MSLSTRSMPMTCSMTSKLSVITLPVLLFMTLPCTSPTGPVGEVHGKVMNSNTGKVITDSLEVMLHVMGMDLVDKDMVHGQSKPDGTFLFSDVPFDANMQFAVMA